jgi:competence ComEA-like helix-hairpin-helix protein
MSFDVERLYGLLPAIYRVRDDEEKLPLKAVLSVIAEQVAVVEEDLAQLYDDQFIETCAEWVVPYLGELVGARGLYDLRGAVSQRAQVANTLMYRRRKGTAAVLEQVARDVTGWSANAVEFFQVLATTQHMNHVRPNNLSSPDLRRWEPLERASTPFESLSRTADVRRIASRRGKHNIPNVGIFLWRVGAYSLTKSPAYKVAPEVVSDRRYRFSPLGNDVQLFNRPETESQIAHLAGPANVPTPISRRVLDRYLEEYYGRSVLLFEGADEVPLGSVMVCDLSDWVRKPQTKYAIDPVLGRIAAPENRDAPSDLRVTYHYGFSADMGGGEYGRDLRPYPPGATVESVPVDPPTSLQQALDAVSAGGFVDITDSGRYRETLSIHVGAEDEGIEIRARDGRHPSIELEETLDISGAENTEVTLDGLLISGAALRVAAEGLRRLRLRHCTLVPGLSIDEIGVPQAPSIPSLTVEAVNTSVEIEHSIVGGLRVADGNRVRITNSIVDAGESRVPLAVNINSADAAELDALPEIGPATAEAILRRRRAKGPFRSVNELQEVPGIGAATLRKVEPFVTVGAAKSSIAYAALDGEGPGGMLRVENSTIIGKVHTGLMELASNTIFLADLNCKRLQQGCVRFSYLPTTSRAPRRYHCRPEDEDEAVRVRPQFSSLRYGDPGYCQLSSLCAAQIRQGADDGAEMGAFHDLHQPQRESNLRVRLEEYLRFGLEAGVFYAS